MVSVSFRNNTMDVLNLDTVHSYESCSVAHEAKLAQFPRSSVSLGRGDMCTTDFSSLSVCNSSRVGYFRFSALLARTGLKRCNLAALLEFPNVIRPNELNPDDERSHYAAFWTLKKKISTELQTSLFPWK